MFNTMDLKLINNHQAILVQIIRSIQLKKVLSDIDPEPDLNFWRLIHGGFLDLSVIEWCKIFGENSENTHWKVLVDSDEGKSNFRDNLFSHLSISSAQWDENWNHLKDYRNDHVAHHNRDSSVAKYPDLDIALNSSFYYYSYLEGLTEGDRIDTIEAYAERFYKQSRQIAEQAVAATSIFNETVL